MHNDQNRKMMINTRNKQFQKRNIMFMKYTDNSYIVLYRRNIIYYMKVSKLICTSAILQAQIRKPPDVRDSDCISDAREEEIPFARPTVPRMHSVCHSSYMIKSVKYMMENYILIDSTIV